jgi:hypothetical protein
MMIQRFIELGEGYSDIYELFEIAASNKARLAHLMQLNTTINDQAVCSFVVVLHPTNTGDFQPLYICREGIPNNPENPNKRIELFHSVAKQLEKEIVTLEVKPSMIFQERELFYQHLVGILRMNRYIPPLH